MSRLIPNLSNVKPIYKNFQGWNVSTSEIKSYQQLPENTKQYIQFIADFIGVPIKIISVGPGTDEIIHID